MTSPYADGVLWRGTATNRPALIVAIVLLFAAITAPFADQYLAAIIAVAAGAFSITYSRLEVRIDREALVVAMGPWGFPRHVHRIEDLDWVEHISVNRQQAGIGIGQRGSKKRLAGRAILLRPGDAIHFQGKRGIRHRVTVDGALGAVSVLERWVDRRTEE